MLLVVSIILTVFTKTAQYLNEKRNKTINEKLFNNFASPEEKTTLKTIRNIARQKKMVRTQDIQEAIEHVRTKSLSINDRLAILKNLEEQGLIKKDVISINNRPTLTWKP